MTREISYGAWPSPITADAVASGGVDFGPVAVEGGDVWWLERRPSEGGRGVVVRHSGGERADVTPGEVDVRTLVHEYGGGDFAVHGGTLWFSDFDDQRLYRQEPGGEPEPITPEPPAERAHRYADVDFAPDGDRLYAVRERHGEGEPTNDLVRLPADGSGEPAVVASGRDFYSYPRVSPDGDRLAWTEWDHPRMPWDGTELRVGDLADDGSVEGVRTAMGGPEESVLAPAWSPAGDLHAVSDRTGWWNLYRVDPGDDPVPLHPAEAEFGVPQWRFGLSTYAFLDDGRIAAVSGRDGDYRLGLLDPESGDIEETDLPFTAFPGSQVRSAGGQLAFVAASPTTPPSVVRWRPGGEPELLRRSREIDLDDAYVSEPEHVTFPTDGGEEAHALYYPPRNPDVEAPDGERPPLVVTVHGGPTGESHPVFDLETQFFTTRGFAVADVNYRGSTGYGRAYRDRLRGEWGVVDTADCVNVARYLADEGAVDPDRLAIRGGSAGGYAVLCAVAFHDAFDAGVSYYGVADLESFVDTTHKFEARYLDSLVGPLPEAEETYRERSPAAHADGIRCPLLLLQGSEDRVVPPSQSEAMVDALVENGVPHAYVEFEGERHGFRRADSRRRALEAELSFYAQLFGFDADADLDPVELVGDR